MTFLDRARDLVKLGPAAPLVPIDPLGQNLVEEIPEEELQLTLIEHLDELRGRLIKAVIALAIAVGIAFIFTPTIFRLLIGPAPQSIRDQGLVYFAPAEAFLTYFQVALMTGIGFSSPVIIYQILAFVVPALTRKERRLMFSFMPLVVLFFILGVLFGYYITLPFALKYLLEFTVDGILRPMINAASYIEFVMTILFWMGLAFETPIIIFFLSKIGLVNTRRLTAWRKYSILAAFVLAAVITPTPDPLNQALVAVPLWILYEVGIILSRFA